MATVIVGGGIIGLSTAYYLSLAQSQSCSSSQSQSNSKDGSNGVGHHETESVSPQQEIHIIDSAPSLLLSASGYAGGFLAKDWFSPASSSLGKLSFRLHRELADKHDGRRQWGYAASTAYSLAIDETGVGITKKVSGKDWLLEGTSRAEVRSTDSTVWSVADTKNGARIDESVQVPVQTRNKDEMLNADGTPAWITRQEGGTLELISSEDGCAQVEPRELCEWLINQCKQQGVKIHLNSKILGLYKGEEGKANGVRLTDRLGDGDSVIRAANIVLTAGAWTPTVFQTLFPCSKTTIRIDPLAGYSIVVRSPRYSQPIIDPTRHKSGNVTGQCHSVFCPPGSAWRFAPEAISRMTRDGRPEVYVAGLNDKAMQLPENVAEVKKMMDRSAMKDLRQTTVLLTGLSNEGDDLVEDDLEIVREGLCFRPVSITGQPIIGKFMSKQLAGDASADLDTMAVFMAAGHGPWGISLGPGTGYVVAELLQGKKTSANIRALGPV